MSGVHRRENSSANQLYKKQAFIAVNSKPQVLARTLFKKLDEKCWKKKNPTLQKNKRKDLRRLWTGSAVNVFSETPQCSQSQSWSEWCKAWEKGSMRGSPPPCQRFWHPNPNSFKNSLPIWQHFSKAQTKTSCTSTLGTIYPSTSLDLLFTVVNIWGGREHFAALLFFTS